MEKDLNTKFPESDRTEEMVAVLAFRGAHRAYQYADRVVRRKGLLSENDIKNIHGRCMENLLPEGAVGVYRTLDVGISKASIVPPFWQRVSALMGEFVKELNRRVDACSHNADNLAYLINAIAFCHYAFVRIHPFEDGNGRTVRIFCDLIAKKFKVRPIVVWPYERDRYIDTLEAVNKSGNLAHLELFLIERLLQGYEGSNGIRSDQVRRKLEELMIQKQDVISGQNNQTDQSKIWSLFGNKAFRIKFRE